MSKTAPKLKKRTCCQCEKRAARDVDGCQGMFCGRACALRWALYWVREHFFWCNACGLWTRHDVELDPDGPTCPKCKADIGDYDDSGFMAQGGNQ